MSQRLIRSTTPKDGTINLLLANLHASYKRAEIGRLMCTILIIHLIY
jgi:hypothetical protein